MLYDQTTELKKTKEWFTDGLACYAHTTQKWANAASQFLIRIGLKDNGEGKFPQWADIWAMHIGSLVFQRA